MKLYVVGNPIKHSLSPLIHNQWLKQQNKKAVYEKKEVKETDLEEIVNLVREGYLKGINVTIPFKETIIKYVDRVDANVIKSRAANTLFVQGNKVVATNTDGLGLLSSLKNDCKFEVKGKTIFILGAGGAARGIVFSLIQKEVKKIIIQNRNEERAIRIKKDFCNNSKIMIEHRKWEDQSIPSSVDLLINSTSIGMNEKDIMNINLLDLKKTSFVYDIVYSKKPTKLIQEAQKLGLGFQRGHAMLVRQAAESFKIWFGTYPDEKKISDLIQYIETQT